MLVERDSYLLELARYVVLNPLRAKMVKRLDAWPWSSYFATCGHSTVSRMVRAHEESMAELMCYCKTCPLCALCAVRCAPARLRLMLGVRRQKRTEGETP